jgi:hypothetical protein
MQEAAMLVNHDPDGKPTVTEAMARRAKESGFHIINVICDEPGAKVGDPGGISFLAIVPFIPRKGEFIVLDKGRRCAVDRIEFRVIKFKDDEGGMDSISLFPNVIAVLMEKRG